jgi:transcriptional regulator with XRE-family HTH domain
MQNEGTRLRPFLTPKVTAADVAREAGCSRQFVSAVMHGHSRPTARLLDAAERLGVPVRELYPERAAD